MRGIWTRLHFAGVEEVEADLDSGQLWADMQEAEAAWHPAPGQPREAWAEEPAPAPAARAATPPARVRAGVDTTATGGARVSLVAEGARISSLRARAAALEGCGVAVVGTVVARREHAALTFADVEEAGSGRLQVAVRAAELRKLLPAEAGPSGVVKSEA